MRKNIAFIGCIVFLYLINSCVENYNTGYSVDKVNDIPSELDLPQITQKIDSLFNAPEQFHEGVKSYQEGDKYGFINEHSEVVIPAIYEHVGCFNEGLASVTMNGKMGFINHSGKVVIPAIYDFTSFFSQGLALAYKDGKFGYINQQGKIIIDFTYDYASDFWDPYGFAAVKLNGKAGLIDQNGNIVVPISFDDAFSSMDGVATLYDGNTVIYVYNDKSYKITYL